MESLDTFVMEYVAALPDVTPDEVNSLACWWSAERQGNENLAAFLTRQSVFIAGADRHLEMMRKGYVRFGATHFFTADGIDILHKNLSAAVGVLEEMSESSSFQLPPSFLTPAPPEPQRHLPPTALVAIDPFPTAEASVLRTVAAASAAPANRPLDIGGVVGKCLLTELLGQGGCGKVFRALHQGLNIPVAVKVLQRDALAHSPGIYQRLKSEARLLAQVNHPSIVRVLDFDDDGPFPYIVLEYVEGLSLAELIHQSGSLRLHRAVKIITQVAGALAAARKIGIVHRDVKPANILLAKDGAAKLADLGLAIVLDDAHSLGGGAGRDDLAGTVAYMAPEQFSNAGAADHRADIYALGATFYHAVAGQVPFVGATPLEVMLKHAQEPLVLPHVLSPDLDPAASAVILRMMAKNPAERFQTYDDLLAALWTLPATHTPQGATQTASSVLGSTSSDPQGRGRSSIWKSLIASFGRAAPGELRSPESEPLG